MRVHMLPQTADFFFSFSSSFSPFFSRLLLAPRSNAPFASCTRADRPTLVYLTRGAACKPGAWDGNRC